MKTVAIEEIAPYMNETPICEQTFIDCGFERIDVPVEESGGEWTLQGFSYLMKSIKLGILKVNYSFCLCCF